MSRFVNLEFGDQFEDRSENEPVLEDEPYYFAKAKRAFEEGQLTTLCARCESPRVQPAESSGVERPGADVDRIR